MAALHEMYPGQNWKQYGERPDDVQYEYAVDTYQVGVPNGDCSIHLQVQRGNGGGGIERTGAHRGNIVKAILVDGGSDWAGNFDKAREILKESIGEIQQDYRLQETTIGQLRFDSWVVTHWDRDHWAGALSMIIEELWYNDTRRSRYMEYDSNGEPLTTLYCPNWKTLSEIFSCVTDTTLHVKPKPMELEVHEPAEEGNLYVDVWVGGIVREKVFKVRFGPHQLLGVDFFTGEGCFPDEYRVGQTDASFEKAFMKYFKNIQTVIEWTNVGLNKTQEGQPRFYCIAVGGFVLGNQMNKDDLKKAFAQRAPNWDAHDTWANMSSIMAVLHFRGAQHLSLYWAGDSVTMIEESIAASTFLLEYRVTVAKWSHHGSRYSNPEPIFHKLKPDKIVVSSNTWGNYGHPSPDVVVRYIKYLELMKVQFGPIPEHVYALRFPGWMKKANWSTKFGLPIEKLWAVLSPIQRMYIFSDINLRLWGVSEKNLHCRYARVPGVQAPKAVIQYLLIESSADNSTAGGKTSKDGRIEIFARPAETPAEKADYGLNESEITHGILWTKEDERLWNGGQLYAEEAEMGNFDLQEINEDDLNKYADPVQAFVTNLQAAASNIPHDQQTNHGIFVQTSGYLNESGFIQGSQASMQNHGDEVSNTLEEENSDGLTVYEHVNPQNLIQKNYHHQHSPNQSVALNENLEALYYLISEYTKTHPANPFANAPYSNQQQEIMVSTDSFLNFDLNDIANDDPFL